jgi:hypothetical protein
MSASLRREKGMSETPAITFTVTLLHTESSFAAARNSCPSQVRRNGRTLMIRSLLFDRVGYPAMSPASYRRIMWYWTVLAS